MSNFLNQYNWCAKNVANYPNMNAFLSGYFQQFQPKHDLIPSLFVRVFTTKINKRGRVVNNGKTPFQCEKTTNK